MPKKISKAALKRFLSKGGARPIHRCVSGQSLALPSGVLNNHHRKRESPKGTRHASAVRTDPARDLYDLTLMAIPTLGEDSDLSL
jgi:hypothetical protein